MAATDWDRTNGATFVTEDDSGGANIFGENSLKIPSGDTGFIFIKDSVFNQADMYVEMDWYKTLVTPDFYPAIGGRVVDAAGGGFIAGDGYWWGSSDSGGSQRMRLMERTNGVFTILRQPTFEPGANTLLKSILNIKGSNIAAQVLDSSGAVLISVGLADTAISAAGTAGLALFQSAAANNIFIDNFDARNAA